MSLLEDLTTRFFEEKTYAYLNHVKAFIEFIENKGVNEQNLIPYLQGVRTKHIVEALGFYIDRNKVIAKDAALVYKSAIKEFLYFILDSEEIQNPELIKELGLPVYKEESYNATVNKYIADHNSLKERKGFGVLDHRCIEDLILQCNNLLSSEEELIKSKDKKKFFNKIRSAVIVKLILLTGVPYRAIRNLDVRDIKIDDNTINLNGFIIHIPKTIKEDLTKYVYISKHLRQNQEKLFIEFEGHQINFQTGNTSAFLKGMIGRGDLNALVKFTITEMIRNGVSESVIRQLHGIEKSKMDIIEICHANVYTHKEANRHLDSKIRQSELYDIL